MKPVRYLSISFISGCSQDEQGYSSPPTIEGDHIDVEDRGIVVVNGITKEKAIQMSWEELIESTEKKFDVHVFHNEDWFSFFQTAKKGRKLKYRGIGSE